jgi:hypothetical protein
MNCANHPEAPAAGYCRNCGKALCAACVRNVRGMLYCEDCLARVVRTPAAPPAGGAGSPALAAILGFIPGLGAVYNGEYTKAVVHVGVFAGLAAALSAHISDPYQVFLGLGFVCFYLYMPIDAYRAANARRAAAYPAAIGAPTQGAPAVPGAAPAAPVGAVAPAAPSRPKWWVGPVILVVLGVLFLLGNFGLLEGDWPRVVGPFILIALGGWLLWRRAERSDGMTARCACASCQRRGLLGPVVLITLGVLWLLGRLGGVYSLHMLWPVLLLVIGAVKVAEALASREGHVGN